MIVLAVDPGKMTGLALWLGDEVHVSAQGPLHQAMNWCESVVELYQELGLQVVCEDFVITQATIRMGRDDSAIQGKGVVRWLAAKHGLTCEMQKPSDAKKFSTDDKLRALGWYRPSPGGHVNDALRHLLLYLVKAGRQDIIRAIPL